MVVELDNGLNVHTLMISESKQNILGTAIPNWDWACFVCYLKSINTFLKSNMITLKQISQKT